MLKPLLACAGLAALAACASQQSEPAPHNPGEITLGGVTPAQALGAVDTSKLVGAQAGAGTGNVAEPANAGAAQTAQSDDASIRVEGVSPAAVLGAIDTTKLVDGEKPKAEN